MATWDDDDITRRDSVGMPPPKAGCLDVLIMFTGLVVVFGGAVLFALGVTWMMRQIADHPPAKPRVITTEDNRIIDMPPGVIWVVRGVDGTEREVDF